MPPSDNQLSQAKRLHRETGVSMVVCLLAMRVHRWDYRRAKALVTGHDPTTRMLHELLDRIEALEATDAE